MKMFIVMFMIVIALTQAKAHRHPKERHLIDIHSKCMEESGVDEESFGRAMMGDLILEPRFKNHALCFSRNMGFMSDEGEILIDETKRMMYDNLDSDRAELVISKCLITKETPEDTAFEMSKCMFEVKFASK